MPVLISLLRGINVGGHNRIKMAALRTLYESLGLQNPQTYIQTGNVVFGTDERELDQLGATIEDGIDKSFGFRPTVILRTFAGLRKVIAWNPLADRGAVDPRKLAAGFLASKPTPKAVKRARALKTDPEEMWIKGSEVYMYFPNGMGRSKLSWTSVEKILDSPGTVRNWNTVNRLAEMAESLEGSG